MGGGCQQVDGVRARVDGDGREVLGVGAEGNHVARGARVGQGRRRAGLEFCLAVGDGFGVAGSGSLGIDELRQTVRQRPAGDYGETVEAAVVHFLHQDALGVNVGVKPAPAGGDGAFNGDDGAPAAAQGERPGDVLGGVQPCGLGFAFKDHRVDKLLGQESTQRHRAHDILAGLLGG